MWRKTYLEFKLTKDAQVFFAINLVPQFSKRDNFFGSKKMLQNQKGINALKQANNIGHNGESNWQGLN